jgi:hypothetical protein
MLNPHLLQDLDSSLNSTIILLDSHVPFVLRITYTKNSFEQASLTSG